MVRTVEELKALSYRQLQAECKAHGIPARGKSDELLGKLILKLQTSTSDEATAAVTPPPKKATAPRTSNVAVAPPATTPSPRKKVDRSVMEKAMSTPLPTSPAKPRTPASSARAKSHKLGRPFLLGAVTAILLAGLTALAIPYCQKYNCPERAQHAYESSVAQAQHCYTATVALGQQYTTVAVDWTKHSAGVVTEAAKTNWGRVAERAGQALDAAKAQYEAVVSKIQEKVEGSNIPSPRPRGYTGALNTAVLKAVLRADEGLLWENLHQSLEDVWAGRKMNENKGNTVMFVCDVADVCSAALDELSAAAPKDATLVLTPADAAEGKGALQAKLAAFLSEQPRGVVVIANIGRFPLETIPVLSNAMGEGGGFQMDGVNVSATDATYLLTFEVAPAIMASDGAANLSVAAKAELDVALTAADAASVDEGKSAIAQSFRRRIELIAPLSDSA